MGFNTKDGYVPVSVEPVDGVDANALNPNAAPHRPAAPHRRWASPWYQCCGECDGVGWGVCCLTYWFFPCVFGYLKHRAFGDARRALAWGALFTLLASVPYFVMYGEVVIGNNALKAAEGDDNFGMDDPRFGPNNPNPVAAERYNSYIAHSLNILYLYSFMSLAAGIAVWVAGAWNRMLMRKKFGIATTDCCGEASPDMEHVCLWFWCNQCALCQEVRTVIKNNVEEGVWQGPDAMVASTPAPWLSASHAAPPTVQHFESAAGKV